MTTIPPEVRTRIGARLRELRGGRSQGVVAQLSGLSQPALSNYEMGKRELPLGTALVLATVLGVRLADLLEGVRVDHMGGITL